MLRATLLGVACLVPVSTVTAPWQGSIREPRTPDIVKIKDLVKNKNKVYLVVQKHGTNGHVTIAVPGQGAGRTRVYDGNILGGLKDIQAGRKITNPSVEKKLNLYLTNEFGKRGQYSRFVRNKDTGAPVTLRELRARWHLGSEREVIDRVLRTYYKKGNVWTISYNKKTSDSIKVFPVDGSAADLRHRVEKFAPEAAKTPKLQNLRCNFLVHDAVPQVTPPGKGQANDYYDYLSKKAEARREADPKTKIRKALEPKTEILPAEKSRQKQRNTKPGGVILSATAEIRDLDPKSIVSASFDPSTGTLTLVPRRGPKVTYQADADDFAVAFRSVFDDRTDPSLSMSFSDRKGYFAVSYTGPLFKTHVGKLLYETDTLLGKIVFNRKGAHRPAVVEIMPDYPVLALEANASLKYGSRVFLNAKTANFAVKYNRIVPVDVGCTVEVEGLGYGASYYHRPLIRLARHMSECFDLLAQEFDVFAEFERVAQVVAIVKWLHAHDVPFDRKPLADHKPAIHDFPAYVPSDDWQVIFNGTNLDGWHTTRVGKPMTWSSGDGSVTVRSVGKSDCAALLRTTWAQSFDLKLFLETKGKASLLVRGGKGNQRAQVDFDTKGEIQELEFYFRDGKWTVLSPNVEKTGTVVVPKQNGRLLGPNLFGVYAFNESSITLHAAYFRAR